MEHWLTLFNQLADLLPVLTFAVVCSAVIYFVFVVLPVGGFLSQRSTEKVASTNDDFGLLLGPSYVLMTSLFGVTLGIFFTLLGGFQAAGSVPASAGGNLTASVAAAVAAVLTVVGTLFLEGGSVGLRRPVGAIGFLLCFVVTGLYWSRLIH